MSTVVKDLGAVSAYAYAVEKGYTGTEAEYAELMASYATVGQTAVDAKDTAVAAKTAAETAAGTATNKASEASQSASTASAKATEATTAAGTATTAKNDAVAAKTAAETAQGKAEGAQAAAEAVAESIPSDYSQLSADVSDIKENLSGMNTATSADVGKALKAKTVTNGKVTEWEFGEAGGIDPETLNLLVEDVTNKDYFVANDYKVDTCKNINADGSISEETTFNNAIYAFPANDYQGIAFHTIKGPTTKYVAFYTATDYAGCNANTFISAINYPNDTDCVYDFPEGTKMCLLNSRGDVYGNWYYYTNEKVPRPDAVVDVESVAGMTSENQIYRLGNKIYYWNGTEFTDIKSGEDEELNNILALLVEDKKTKDEISSPTVAAEYKNIDNSGNIVDQTTYHTYIWAIPVTTPCTGIGFNTVKGNGKYLAFYTAETFEECSSETLISLVNYTNNQNVEYLIPEGTKMCLINCRGDYYGLYLYTIEKVSKATEEIEDFREELNTEIGTTMNVADFGVPFVRGRLNNTNGEIISSVHQCISTEDITIDRTIQYNFDNDVLVVIVYYRKADGTYSSNGGQAGDFYRTILKGSVVRFNIAKRGSTARLTDGELVTLPQAITFNTALEDWKEYVNDNCDYEAVCAKMFEKGRSEKTFSNAVGILAAGQSNINGRVPSSSLPSDIVPPFANIKNSIQSKTGTFSNSMSLPSSWGVDFSLYDALNKLGQDFYVMKWSEGGTSISPYGTGTNKWTPFYEELDSISKSLLWSFEEQIRACMANNPNTFNPRALIWHQGEGDFSGNSKKAALAYYKNFKCLIAYIRGIVGNERLPIIYGTISHSSGQYCPVVEEAQLKIAQEDPYAYCIDMSGAGLIDSYHFDADACVYFGRMAYDALIDFGVITGTKINPTRPW